MKVVIERLDDFGRGIAFINNKICFIENALKDEEVEIEIIKDTKKYLEAKVIKYLKVSPNRVEAICPYYDICGGCNLRHISFKDENNYKENKVRNIVNKFSDIDSNLVKDINYHEESNYRNKVTLHGKDNKLGLYKRSSNEIVEISNCLLVNNKINELIKLLRKNNKNIKEAIIKTSNNEEESLIKIVGEVNNIEEILNNIDVLIINNELISNKNKIKTNIGNKSYYQSADSFFQVNKTLAKDLYDEALQVVKEIKTNRVLDLYCGTGTIGIYLSNYCDEIIGIDYNKSNIEDAILNKELNNLNNIEFICDKVENKIDAFKDIDLIVVDPPRAGLDQKTRDNIQRIEPDNIIYISCDPITLIRDINELKNKYQIIYIKPFNMFPKTYHIECVALLRRKVI